MRQTPYLTEHLVSWIMALSALPLCALVLYHIRESNCEVGDVNVVGDGRIESDEKVETGTKDQRRRSASQAG